MLALFVPWPVLAQSESEAVRASQSKRFAAMIEADVELLRPLLADELVYTHTTGRVETKLEFLSALSAGTLAYESIRLRGVEVRVYGEAAVATGESEMRVRMGGEALAFTIRFLEAYVRRDGRWQLVAWQSTRLP